MLDCDWSSDVCSSDLTKDRISRRYVIELKLDGTHKLTETNDARDWGIFRSCLALYTWRKNHGI
jgi:hypothetical protein